MLSEIFAEFFFAIKASKNSKLAEFSFAFYVRFTKNLIVFRFAEFNFKDSFVNCGDELCENLCLLKIFLIKQAP